MKKILTLLLVGIILTMTFKSGNNKEGMVNGRKELLLLHMEGCPHCVNLMPEWNKFCKENDTSIKTNMIERDEDRDLVKKYGVEGFPTILLLNSKKEKIKTYEGPRTAEALLDFCHENN